jgi:hypothetical protein
VEIRSAAEILATLDDRGTNSNTLFMPEMIPHLGGRHRVAQRALKVCTPSGNVNLRSGLVFLDDLRCDGAAHGGCQMECRLFWRKEWLRPVGPDSPAQSAPSDAADIARLIEIATVNAAAPGGEKPTWRCQATTLNDAGELVSWKEPTQYVREITARNVGLLHFIKVLASAIWRSIGRKLSIVDRLPTAGADRVDGESLGLQPGEWVEVRSLEEIGRTLDDNVKHRGLSFTDEMAQHCGQRFQVHRRVERVIDETSGRMLEFRKNAYISLEGLFCTGDRAPRLWFCRKDHYPFWREAWLRRVDDGPVRAAASGPAQRSVDRSAVLTERE